MTELNQADLFTGRAPVDGDLTPVQRMKMIRRRFGRCKTQTEDGRCIAWTTSDGQPMKITPERCLRCLRLVARKRRTKQTYPTRSGRGRG
jgi:hypothetical protein